MERACRMKCAHGVKLVLTVKSIIGLTWVLNVMTRFEGSMSMEENAFFNRDKVWHDIVPCGENGTWIKMCFFVRIF